MLRVYVVDVRRANRGPQVCVSRTHPNLVRRLFELEVPEIGRGIDRSAEHRPGRPAPGQRSPFGRCSRILTRWAPA